MQEYCYVRADPIADRVDCPKQFIFRLLQTHLLPFFADAIPEGTAVVVNKSIDRFYNGINELPFIRVLSSSRRKTPTHFLSGILIPSH